MEVQTSTLGTAAEREPELPGEYVVGFGGSRLKAE